ncbi:MAG: hypothetical protein E7029_01090 [Planctomycetaceae bacterium]|nr:hypothetical protein [Planctomycetaceae bacterium]
MRLTNEFCEKYMIDLEVCNSWLPETPEEILKISMGYNKFGICYLGIDPKKQNWIILKSPLRIVDDSSERTVRAALPTEIAGEYLNLLFPRFGILLRDGEIIAVTQAVKEDYLQLNNEKWKIFGEPFFKNSVFEEK